MARHNNRPSTVASSRYGPATPGPGSSTSDQENRDPTGAARNKGKERAMPPPPRINLPTPTSDPSDSSRGQKRKRSEVQADATQGDQEDEVDSDEEKHTKYYDPNQDPEIRRQVKRKSRALEREFNENRDELLRDNGEGLTHTINRANQIYKNVKQTNDATLDSRLMVNVSDLAAKKVAQLVLGDGSTGVDVDEFLSKCITYLRNGGPAGPDAGEDAPPTATQRRRRTRHRDDSDDEGEDDTGAGELDWDLFGRRACFPHNSRPPVPSFLLGPLSVEKKQRTQTQRRARQTKETAGRESRPEALTKDDLQQSDANGLSEVCKRINIKLIEHCTSAQTKLERAGFTSVEELKTERGRATMKKCRVSDNGGVPLFDYVVNPRSFGQTVENIFYISFLIKEGAVGVQHDEEGLPTLVPAQATSLDDQRKNKTRKHQAVLAIDYGTWKQLIDAFEIRESMIPHRDDEQPTQMGERGWYT